MTLPTSSADLQTLREVAESVQARLSNATHITFEPNGGWPRLIPGCVVADDPSNDIQLFEPLEDAALAGLDFTTYWVTLLRPTPDLLHPNSLSLKEISALVNGVTVFCWQLTTGWETRTVFVSSRGALLLDGFGSSRAGMDLESHPTESLDEALVLAEAWTDVFAGNKSSQASTPLLQFEADARFSSFFEIKDGYSLTLNEGDALWVALDFVDALLEEA